MSFDEWIDEMGFVVDESTRFKMNAAYKAGREDVAGDIMSFLGADPTDGMKLLRRLKQEKQEA